MHYFNLFGLKGLKNLEETLWKKYQRKLTKVGALKWSEIGYDILWKLFDGYEYHNIKFERFAPLKYNDWEQFFRNDLSPDDLIKNDSISVMLYNKYMFDPLKNLTRDEVLAQDCLLAKLFKYSLERD